MIRTTNVTCSISRNAGGLYESVRRLVQSLAARGMEVQVLGVRDEFTERDVAAWQPVDILAFKPAWLEKFGYAPELLEALRDFEPDIVHTHGIWLYPSIAVDHFCRNSHRPWMISAHGMLDPWAMRNSRWKKLIAYSLFEGSHLRGARCLRALCEPEARAIHELSLKNDIAIIPNGIDLPKGGKPTSDSAPPPWDGVIETGRKVLLYLSRIHPKKGLVNLLKAWAAVRKAESRKQKVEEWVLAIAGWSEGRHEPELKQLATELGIPWADVRKRKFESREQKVNFSISAFQHVSVLFLGPQFNEAKGSCYRNCDAFILPSFSEGVPMVILEAWAYGKPVLMTPGCNLPGGFVANAALRIDTDVESIMHGLQQLLRSTRSDLCSLGTNGRAVVVGKFTWPKVAAEMDSVYNWILGGGPKPGCIF